MEGESDIATKIIDTLGYNTTLESYKDHVHEVDSVKQRLILKGYINTKIITTIQQNDSVFTSILYIGKKVKTVRINTTEGFDPKWLHDTGVNFSLNYFEVPIEILEQTLSQLNKNIAEQGDPFSSLQLINISQLDANGISADLKITHNKKRRIDKIVLKGYEKFPQSYVKRFLKLRPKQTFNLREITSKTERLNDLLFANEIKTPEVLFTNDSTTLYLYTEKAKSNSFDGFLGFGTNEDTNKLDIDGYLDLRLVNNLNYGETLRLFYKSDEIDQQTINININTPYLLSSPIGLELDLTIFRKDSTFSNTTQQAHVNYQINANHRVKTGLRNLASSNLLDNTTATLDDFDATYFELGYTYTKSQYYDPLFPINAWLDINTSFGNRTQGNLELAQNAIRLDAYKIFNLNNRNSIFLRSTGATLNSDNYLDNELYRLGGINSIRGFEENSLVANLFGVLNTEYRYRLSKTIYIHSVIDAAYLENEIINTTTKLFGFGFGFGLLTNAGVFKFNYASGKTEDTPFRLSDSKIHVSLTARF